MSESTQDSRDTLASDFKTVLTDAEELLKLTADDATGKLSDVRSRLGEHVESIKGRLCDLEGAVTAKAKGAAKATDNYVQDHPWQSVGIAAGAAFLLGMLCSRR